MREQIRRMIDEAKRPGDELGIDGSTDPALRLASEAIRLARMLRGLMPDESEALGLLALVLLHDARRDARSGEHGELVLLDDQDRNKWNRQQIGEGSALVERALRMRRAGPYQLQAAISALHCQAPRAEDTDWPQIVGLYASLMQVNPAPVVGLNPAVAVATSYPLLSQVPQNVA